MKWGPQEKLKDEALLKYYFVDIYLLPIYIFRSDDRDLSNTPRNIWLAS